MQTKKTTLGIGVFFTILFMFSFVSAIQSNESLYAHSLIVNASQVIEEMNAREIPILRANESYQQAVQLYNAQFELEINKKSANYELVNNYALEVINLKKIAFQAQDELKVFLESYNSISQEFNLSEMNPEYEAVIRSFNEERFEETPDLIDKAYNKLSEVQSKQTTLKAFYDTTSRTLKRFLTENWNNLISAKFYLSIYFWIVLIGILLVVFWKGIKRFRIKTQIRNLNIRKDALFSLIKKLQSDYFRTKVISETEYFSKLEKFKDMIRDIDRKLPLLKEQLLRVDRTKMCAFVRETKESSSQSKKKKRRRK